MPFDDDEAIEIPLYATLAREGIYNPALLVQRAIERGEVHPAKPSPTIPRCPVGKKSGAATPSFRILAQAAMGAHHLNP